MRFVHNMSFTRRRTSRLTKDLITDSESRIELSRIVSELYEIESWIKELSKRSTNAFGDWRRHYLEDSAIRVRTTMNWLQYLKEQWASGTEYEREAPK